MIYNQRRLGDSTIPCRSRETFILLVWNVIVRNCIAIAFCEAKVNNVDHVALLVQSHQEIVRFYITMNKVFAERK